MNGVAFYLITMGDFGNAILWALNYYFPMGTFWIFLGLAIYVTVQAKVENQQFSAFAFVLYALAVLPWVQINGASIIPELSKYTYYLVALVLAGGIYTLFIKE